MCDTTTVQVAIRIRPLISSEIERGSQDVLEVLTKLNQIRIKDSDKAFTYNNVFPSTTSQQEFYKTCIQGIIENLFKGYNVTVLAYGQTGSGKTHSLGTAYNGEGEMGVIPLAIHDIFSFVKDNFSYDFAITVSFMELYQEVLYDLLSNKPRDQCIMEIREDNTKGIFIPGLTEEPVSSAHEALKLLARGSLGRATGSTNMNAQSSRSHAIYTISICMQKKGDSVLNKTAKFHLVDLAGSERQKKTGATGQTFKEGVNINKGLLALGNVISALGDDKMQNGYIGYRDSSLTRLLKDSLGGNSITLMIACVSPADYNLEETLSTLRYADRARKIKNKPIVNQDPKAAEINRLQKLVQQLRLELVGQGGPIICQAELELLKKDVNDNKLKNRDLNIKLSHALSDNTSLVERILLMQTANEELIKKIKELKEQYNLTLNNINLSIERNDIEAIKINISKLETLQSNLTNINTEQIKNAEEVRQQESRQTLRSEGLDNSDTEVNERQETYTAKQVDLNTELQEVSKRLAMKERLVVQMVANSCYTMDCNITEYESKISALQTERDELLQQLKNTQVTGASNKIAEQRQKRVQQLERQMQDLNKKVAEQARLIKLREKEQDRIKQLSNEILSMKQMKVQLIKRMREETEKFRLWKMEREKDLRKLKVQDRKQQNQIAKMATMHNKQQNVLKRKVEQAAAINKRLKDALAKRKAVQDMKMTGKLERVAQWIQHEFEIHVNTVDAQYTLNGLLEDRATLYNQLDSLKADPDMADNLEVKQLEDDIQLRSVQIQDIQQKLLDADEDNKVHNRWDNIQSMAESKLALTTLFELVSDIRKKSFGDENRIQELENALLKIKKENEERASKLKEKEIEFSNNEREYEEKISVFLRRVNPKEVTSAGDASELFEIQQNTIESLERKNRELIEESQKLKTENIVLNEKLEEINNLAIQKKTPEKNKKKTKTINEDFNSFAIPEPIDMDNLDVSVDNIEEDPDWRKTPLAKRIQSLNKRNQSMKIIPQEQDRLKRSSGGGCTCKGNCSTRNCGCKKTTKRCSASCKCKEENCVNRGESDQTFIKDEVVDEDSDSNDLKKPSSLYSGTRTGVNRRKILSVNNFYYLKN